MFCSTDLNRRLKPIGRVLRAGRAHVGEDRICWLSCDSEFFFFSNAVFERGVALLCDQVGPNR